MRLFGPRRSDLPRDCTCGHVQCAHEHYRRGSDCALCACSRYRAGAVSSAVLAPVPVLQDAPDERALAR